MYIVLMKTKLKPSEHNCLDFRAIVHETEEAAVKLAKEYAKGSPSETFIIMKAVMTCACKIEEPSTEEIS